MKILSSLECFPQLNHKKDFIIKVILNVISVGLFLWFAFFILFAIIFVFSSDLDIAVFSFILAIITFLPALMLKKKANKIPYEDDIILQYNKSKINNSNLNTNINKPTNLASYRKQSINKINTINTQSTDNINTIIDRSHNVSKTDTIDNATEKNTNIHLDGWYISVSFGKSSSDNFNRAIALAKAAPQYHTQTDNGHTLHQAIYSSKPNEFLQYITLYEVVKNWKTTFIMINGQIIDKKIIGKLNYCYGDKCRSGNTNFCYGASFMTDNPFGCHRLQISAANHPWVSFYRHYGSKWILDTKAMQERIDLYASIYSICPCFDYDNIIREFNLLPRQLTQRQYMQVMEEGHL